MARPSKKAIVAALLDQKGTTFAAEAGINVERNTPSALFRLLCLSLLQSARINSEIAMQAAKGLAERRWTTANAMLDSTWKQRVGVLNDAGYARYQERTATMLEDTARLLADRWTKSRTVSSSLGTGWSWSTSATTCRRSRSTAACERPRHADGSV